jgi:hypothetical protein
MNGVDADALDSVLLDFTNRRASQKAKYAGEFFPSGWPADARSTLFLDFFQMDKQTGGSKGIIRLDVTALNA